MWLIVESNNLDIQLSYHLWPVDDNQQIKSFAFPAAIGELKLKIFFYCWNLGCALKQLYLYLYSSWMWFMAFKNLSQLKLVKLFITAAVRCIEQAALKILGLHISKFSIYKQA